MEVYTVSDGVWGWVFCGWTYTQQDKRGVGPGPRHRTRRRSDVTLDVRLVVQARG